mmetsp:Transcript_5947/g.17801  ORF Transcript_5947/g.17801 Transcript_5947/m.17801 type:complete len:236 (-) Transcript_5947:709-1416(-)
MRPLLRVAGAGLLALCSARREAEGGGLRGPGVRSQHHAAGARRLQAAAAPGPPARGRRAGPGALCGGQGCPALLALRGAYRPGSGTCRQRGSPREHAGHPSGGRRRVQRARCGRAELRGGATRSGRREEAEEGGGPAAAGRLRSGGPRRARGPQRGVLPCGRGRHFPGRALAEGSQPRSDAGVRVRPRRHLPLRSVREDEPKVTPVALVHQRRAERRVLRGGTHHRPGCKALRRE